MQNNQVWQNQQPAQQTHLSDQELAYDMLYQEKALMSNISSEVVEASHMGLRTVLNDAFMQIGQDQLKIFEAMHENVHKARLSSCDTRIFSSIKLSVCTPSMNSRPAPYHSKYPKNTSPSSQICFLCRHSITKPSAFQTDS